MAKMWLNLGTSEIFTKLFFSHLFISEINQAAVYYIGLFTANVMCYFSQVIGLHSGVDKGGGGLSPPKL